MDKLTKTYEAVEMLEALGLPVSSEQLNAIAHMERAYLREEIIPLIKQELEPMVERMKNSFQLAVTYSKENGVDIHLTEPVKQNRSSFPVEEERGFRKKKFIIRVTFPDKRVSCLYKFPQKNRQTITS